MVEGGFLFFGNMCNIALLQAAAVPCPLILDLVRKRLSICQEGYSCIHGINGGKKFLVRQRLSGYVRMKNARAGWETTFHLNRLQLVGSANRPCPSEQDSFLRFTTTIRRWRTDRKKRARTQAADQSGRLFILHRSWAESPFQELTSLITIVKKLYTFCV